MKPKPEITAEIIQKRYGQLAKLTGRKTVSLKDLASELGIKVTALMDFIEQNPKLYTTTLVTKGKSNVLSLRGCYLNPEENPENPEFVEAMKIKNEKTIQISYYDNYGYISGYYIEPSTDELEAKYLNTLEKIARLKNLFKLPQASYVIGGYGDSSMHTVDGGVEIKADQLQKLIKEGWTVIGEFLPDPTKLSKPHPYKVNKA